MLQCSTMATSISGALKALRGASKGLVYSSESDRPIKAIAWSSEDAAGAKTPRDAVAKVAGVAPEQVVAVSLEAFFAPLATPQAWWGESERAEGARFAELVAQLKLLDGAEAFRVGDGPDIAVYVVGLDPTTPGGFVGVKTRITET